MMHLALLNPKYIGFFLRKKDLTISGSHEKQRIEDKDIVPIINLSIPYLTSQKRRVFN